MMQAAILVAALGAASGVVTQPHEVAAKFAAFVELHGRAYTTESEEYQTRLSHFSAHQAAVDAHNSKTDRMWTAGINHLADRSADELAALRGYRHMSKKSGGAGLLGLASLSSRVLNMSHVPANWTWKGLLKAMDNVVDQGGCGSCWAVSSATALRGHAELYHGDRTFSAQQILECSPNPRSCGGTGGCKGATAEIAMDYVARYGSATAEDLEYMGKDGECPSAAQPKQLGFLRAPDVASLTEVTLETGAGAAFGMMGWRKLPENKAEPLMLALYEEGPVVVSVAANDNWGIYFSGVMNACDKDAVINHAVVAVGFGEDDGNKFWQIQNSWGPYWGEEGFIRLLRLDHREEGAYCGWDNSPQDGTACKGGPEKVRVCGQCGVLYDSVVPKFQLGEGGLLAQKSKSTK